MYCSQHRPTLKQVPAHIKWLFVETNGHKLFEGLREVSQQLRWRVLGNEEEHSHWMEVCMRRLSCGKLDGCDTQRPYISLEGEGGGEGEDRWR